jgi:hypothetical protein
MIRHGKQALVMACVALIFGVAAETSQAGVVSYAWQGMFGPPGSLAYYRAARVNARQGIYPQPFYGAAAPVQYSAGYAPMGYSTGYAPYSVGYSPYSVSYAPVDMGVSYGYGQAACCSPCNSCCGGSTGGSCPGGNCGGSNSSPQTYEAGRYPEKAIPDPNASGSGTNSNNNSNPNSDYNGNSGPADDDGFVPPRQNNSGVNENGGDAPSYTPPKNNGAPAPFTIDSSGSAYELPKLQPVGPVASMSWDAKVQPTRMTREARFNLPVMVRHVEQPRILVPAPSPIQIAGK